MIVRLQKFLADCQIASRRKAEELIANGEVQVNGQVVSEQGIKIDTDKDEVVFNGKVLRPDSKKVYIMLHKPDGYITTVKDQFGRPAVNELVSKIDARLYPVGRLDYDTSGLLIMTNDGDLAFKLTHPKHMVDKVYIARVKGTPDANSLKRFETGLELDDGFITSPAKIKVIKEWPTSSSLKITIYEGKNRQVRKMLDAIGHKVLVLKRVATGKLFLGDLQKGQYRHLTNEEIKYLKNI